VTVIRVVDGTVSAYDGVFGIGLGANFDFVLDDRCVLVYIYIAKDTIDSTAALIV
jgi:hypothetical protein